MVEEDFYRTISLCLYVKWGTGEMAQLVQALAVLPEDPGLIPSIQLAAHHCQAQGIWCPFLTSIDTRHIDGAQTYIQENTHA